MAPAGVFSSVEPVHMEPFDAIELNIGRWWLDAG